MKKIYISLLAVGLLAAGCNTKTSVQESTEVSQQPVVTPAKDKAGQQDWTGWKDFTHKEDGYSLKHPAEFTLEESENISPNNTDLFYSASFGFTDKLSTPGTIFITKTNLAEAKANLMKDSLTELSSEVRSINGLDVTVAKAADLRFKDNISYIAYIPNGSGYLIIIIDSEHKAEFDRIVESVKFK